MARHGIWIVCSVALVLTGARNVRADGGTLRLSQQRAGVQISIFTDPTPLRVGAVDVSVLVQDGRTNAVIREGQVTVRCQFTGDSTEAVAGEATTEAATNKLFRAVRLDIPTPGRWRFEVSLQGSREPVQFAFEAEVAGPRPRWLELAPWIGWPFAVVGLFLMNLFRQTRRANHPSAQRIQHLHANGGQGR
jgi:hypothetical protein